MRTFPRGNVQPCSLTSFEKGRELLAQRLHTAVCPPAFCQLGNLDQ